MLKLSLLKKITFVLLGIVIILLVVNIVVTKFVSKNEPPKNREAISGIELDHKFKTALGNFCLLYTSPSPRDRTRSRMPSSA